MEISGTWPLGYPIMQPNEWVAGLANTGILNLLEIPHFRLRKYVNNCIKQLLAFLHGGFLWLEELISIYIEVISFITSLPSNGENPMDYLDDKTKEKALAEEMKKTYGIERDSRTIIIKRINDAATRMAMKLMGCKLVHKCHEEEVPTTIVATTTQCTNNTMLSWALYLLNLFLDDYNDA
jgi:hypothetical protein